jgi:hypothetical protein
MYSGKHFRAGLAAACRAGTVGAGKRLSQPHSHPNSNACSYPDSYSHPNAYAIQRRWRQLRGSVERRYSLSGRQCGERRQQQLHGAVLESRFKSNHRWQQRPCRDGRSLVFSGALHYGHSNANPQAYAYSQPHSYANSASARQHHLRCL